MAHSDCCAFRYADFAARVDARPMLVSLDTKPVRDQSQPLVFDGGEQLRLTFAGTGWTVVHSDMFRQAGQAVCGLVGAACVTGGCAKPPMHFMWIIRKLNCVS